MPALSRLSFNLRSVLGRIAAPVVVTYVLFLALVFGVMLPGEREAMLAAKKDVLVNLTKMAWDILDRHHRFVMDGESTLAQAQQDMAEVIRSLRVGTEENYFWVSDLEGRVVVHPFRPELENRNLDELTGQDRSDLGVVRRMAVIAALEGEGFVEYQWQRNGHTTEVQPKVAHVRLYEPWGWIVGTGLYLEDVESHMARATRTATTMSAVILGLGLLTVLYVIHQSLREDRTRRALHQDLLSSEAKYRGIVENAPVGIVQMTREGRIVQANPGAAALFGYPGPAEVAAEARFDDLYPYSAEREALHHELGVTGLAAGRKLPAKRLDGADIWTLLYARETNLLHGGQPLYEAFILDITHKEQADVAIQKSLAEKEVLLREIHHRVKNNLQVVSSLLYLQLDKVQNPADQELFLESQNRVRAMALIHEELYRTGDFAAVDLKPYVEKLVPTLVQAYGGSQEVILELAVERTHVDIQRAVPFGLLLNELVTNAVKHAWRGEDSTRTLHAAVCPDPERRCVLTVALTLEGGRAVLRVADNGRGLPPDYDIRRDGGLGMQLITNLAQQLGGDLRVSSDNGTDYSIGFVPDRPGGEASA